MKITRLLTVKMLDRFLLLILHKLYMLRIGREMEKEKYIHTYIPTKERSQHSSTFHNNNANLLLNKEIVSKER